MGKFLLETRLCDGDVSQDVELPLPVKDALGERPIGSIVELYFNGTYTLATLEITDAPTIKQFKAGREVTIGIVNPELGKKLQEAGRISEEEEEDT